MFLLGADDCYSCLHVAIPMFRCDPSVVALMIAVLVCAHFVLTCSLQLYVLKHATLLLPLHALMINSDHLCLH
jgi:hypothetical protein